MCYLLIRNAWKPFCHFRPPSTILNITHPPRQQQHSLPVPIKREFSVWLFSLYAELHSTAQINLNI